jgi:hypothetical protein
MLSEALHERKAKQYFMKTRITGSLSTLSASLILAGFLASVSSPASAQIVDGSFETPVISGLIQEYTEGSNFGAWLVLGNPATAINVVNTNYSEPAEGMIAFNAEDGNQFVDLTGPSNEGTSLGVQQTVTTTGGQQYALTFYVGKADSDNGSSSYSGPAVADVSINGGSLVPFTNADTGTSGFQVWDQFTYDFTAAGSSTTLAFYDGTSSSNANNVGLDNVSLTQLPPSNGTPEPAPIVMLASGGLVWAMLRRRWRGNSVSAL